MSKINNMFGNASNMAGASGALAGGIVAGVLTANPLIALAAAGAMYAAGYVVFWKPNRTINITRQENADREELVKSVQTIRSQITRGNHLPKSITVKTQSILAIIEDLLSDWKKVSALTEAQHALSSITTEYLPNALNAFLSLPKSYLSRRSLNAENKTLEQLSILERGMEKIQDAVYQGFDDKMNAQTIFLKEKFGSDSPQANLKL